VVRNLKSLKQLTFGGNHAGIMNARWAINKVLVQLKVPTERSIRGTANTQFRWSFYEYLWGQLRPLLLGAKWTWMDFSI